MPDLLLELFSEEIPARMQARAAADLKKLITDKLVDAGLVYEGAESFVTPRRLTLVMTGIPTKTPDMIEERKGPKVGAPEKALEGFMRAAGLTSIDQAEIKSDPKKGDFYIAKTEKAGRDAAAIIAETVKEAVLSFPWPKSMRWGTGSLRWVRPLHNILCTFGVEGEPPEVINVGVEGVGSKAISYGHRFMAPDAFDVKRYDDYVESLEKAHVMLDPARRRDTILNDAKNLAFAQGLELVEDQGLLNEVAGLVEWPVVLLGRFDEDFLAVPEEVIITSLKSHQKCFCLKESATGKLSNAFILVSNLIARDGGDEIIAGNQKVIRARLADARFFWDTDQAVKLGDRVPSLDNIIFHQKLGSQGDRVRRIEELASRFASMVGADASLAQRAASLSKADLVSEMVGEFPELQGLMGRYYAEIENENAQVSLALEEHYRPQGPSEPVPSEPVSIAVALADKFDMLTGFWSIDEKPTGSKDPFALRRAALGVVRIILENKLNIDLKNLLASTGLSDDVAADLYRFMEDRMTVYLKDQGERYDHIAAIVNRDVKGDITRQVEDIHALAAMLNDSNGADLMAGLKRASNMVASEEKKSGSTPEGSIDMTALAEAAEISLSAAITEATTKIDAGLKNDQFSEALSAFAALRNPIDTFFSELKVDADDPKVKANRLALLVQLRALGNSLADFSRIEG